ncbi:predicted protein [Nematostella vectensis]|uniref:Uncharacterized protein n=1 Tax=Nematostella vectensis TaxID=45351 RepID=A7S7K8_NEMVE|nr:predicted protein [Nematostella vectensis]|eukprot:XP_001632384.1 predicted protein [Nematostella vectensis]
MGRRFLERHTQNIERYGKLYKREAQSTIVYVADVNDAEKILRYEAKYPHRIEDPVISHYMAKRQAIPGVFFSNGNLWYKHRRAISKKLLVPRMVEQYVPTYNAIVDDFLARLSFIKGPEGSSYENEVSNLQDELFRFAFESVGFLLFDKRFGLVDGGEDMRPEVALFAKSLDGFLRNIVGVSDLPLWFYKLYETRTYKDVMRSLDGMYHCANVFVDERIKEMEQEEICKDFEKDVTRLDFFTFLLLRGNLKKEDLLASVIDLIFAGSDTTANTFQWALYLMGKNPKKQEKLHKEVRSVLGANDCPTSQHISNMPYVTAWLKETLRMYGTVPFVTRKLPVEITLQGYKIPAWTSFVILTSVISRDKDNFDEPLVFRPERWLRDDTGQKRETFNALASLPFGFGKRMCVGRRIAELELRILLAKTTLKFKVAYPHEDRIEPFMRATLIPDLPLRVSFIDRKH